MLDQRNSCRARDFWSVGADFEVDNADREPSLASPEARQPTSQVLWAWGGYRDGEDKA